MDYYTKKFFLGYFIFAVLANAIFVGTTDRKITGMDVVIVSLFSPVIVPFTSVVYIGEKLNKSCLYNCDSE